MAREFGSPGMLTTETPSLLTRRDAVSRLATQNRTERNLYKRAFRNINRLARRGDEEAGVAALDLWDRAQKANIPLTGIPNAGQEFDRAAIELRDQQQFNADVQGLVTPNETLATTNLPSQPATVGTGTGINATRTVPGPSAAQGGPLSSQPIYSSRDGGPSPLTEEDERALDFAESPAIYSSRDGGPSPLSERDQRALDAAATPAAPAWDDPTVPFYPEGGGPPSRALVIPEDYGGGVALGEDLDQQFRRRYPNSARFLDAARGNPADFADWRKRSGR
jgi:hypothetical protein